MVEDRRAAVLYAVNIGGLGGKTRSLKAQMPVESPPHTVEYVKEALRIIAFDGNTARHCAVDVVMGIDETGHDQPALGVDEFSRRVLCLQRGIVADLGDQLPVADNCAVLDERIRAVPRDDPSVSDK